MNPVLHILYRLYRLSSAVTHWVHRRFTLVGQAVFGAVCVAVVTALDIDGASGYQAVVPLAAVLVVAFVCSVRFKIKLAVERHLPRVATAGTPFTYRVAVQNLTPKNQTGLTLVENLADPRPAYRDWRDFKLDEDKHVRPFRFDRRRFRSPFTMATVKEADLPPLRPQQRAEVVVEMTPLRRGVVRWNGCTIARPDPLGIYRALRAQPLPQSMIVLPRRYPLPPIALPGGMKYQQGGVAMASHIGQSEEFVSLREYRHGDPPRHIHWRSWAKVGKPIVKEFEDEFFVRHALILDTFTPRPHSDVFEEAVSVAASFACTVLTQESLLDLLFVGAEAYCFTAGRGLAHADQMLEILASVRPAGLPSLASLETLVLNHVNMVSGCICVFLAWDEARQKLVEKLKMLEVPVLVVVIQPAGETKPLPLGPMADTPDQLHALEVGRIEEQLAKLR
jgi:uncharacterized protein (DUF58 family)